MLIRDAILLAVKRLSAVSPSPRLDVEVLLAHTLNISKLALLVRFNDELPSKSEPLFQAFIERRLRLEPIAYITGHKEFFGLDFTVTPDVLVPRPETELLVERAVAISTTVSTPLRILDLGTGSGCIALAIASELKKSSQSFSILALDSSQAALKIAEKNANQLKQNRNVDFMQSDWFSALVPGHDSFDIVLSNPPYINPAFTDLPEDLKYEPQGALFSADSGLSDIKRLVQTTANFLKPNGVFLCEIGAEQKVALQYFLTEEMPNHKRWYNTISFIKDLSGCDRILELRQECVSAAK